jgi:hypothetical protein
VASETDLAYLAGLIDGEGCIRIKKAKAYRCQGRRTPSYTPAIHVRMVDEPAIAFLEETLGGWTYKEKPHSRGGRPLFCWQASGNVAAGVLRALRPYLRIKGEQADVALELVTLKTESQKHRTKVLGYRDFPNQYGTVRRVPNLALSDEYVERCDALYRRCRELKVA